MGQIIMKLHDERDGRDWYLEWSTVVDAPVSDGMPLDDFMAYYRDMYGERGMAELPARMERVKANGVSGFPPYDDLDDFFEWNRAGEGETTLDKLGIIDRYCRATHSTERSESDG